jgi:hypothetical protein
MRDSIPRIEQCIQYIKDCGYVYQGYRRPWPRGYVFTHHITGREFIFTLTEIRYAFKHGW